MSNTTYDCIIVGAGLAGLTGAIFLQKAGFNVLVIEQNDRPGGLCGTFKEGDYEFVIACNDFCGKVPKILQDLDVNIDFIKAKTRFYINDNSLNLPPDIPTLFQMIKMIPGLYQLYRYVKSKQNDNGTLTTLAQAISYNKTLSEFIMSLAYPYGATPDNVLITHLKEEFSDKYKYDLQNSVIPVGGPNAIIDAMVKKLLDLGGQLELKTQCQAINSMSEFKQIITNNKTYFAREVLTSEAKLKDYPSTFHSGLSTSKIVVALDKEFVFPKGFHTIAYFPKNCQQSINKIDKGMISDSFAFHLFPTWHHPADIQCLNIYFYLPRGIDAPTNAEIKPIKDYIFNKMDAFLPGFKKHLLFEKFISVNAFKQLHNLSSLVRLNIDPHFIKPQGYDKEKDIYYIGNSVYPPGNHTGAAMLSALLAAQAILAKK